ncbi:hypothetical protein M0813_08780 [Anaeramoeba flamelloides]|uniref:Uncharacterized protein n=1 Tax=Anaeramoeba flamelloides TaxID=1746091 RepID=A0ABQ8X6Z6_9EUKA|nr:hypothetical protein M0813_08780 [Anaeramoeba flamelloides]
MTDLDPDQEITKESNLPINNKHTKHMRGAIFKRFLQHLKDRNKPTEIEKIENLDEETCLFIARMKQKNGQDYNWNSYRSNVHNLFGAIKDYYLSKGLEEYPELKRQYLTSNRYKRKLTELKVDNKFNKRSRKITKEEELSLFKSLDMEKPEDLILAAFWSIAKYGGLTREENYTLLDEQVRWGSNEMEGKYIQVSKNKDRSQNKKQNGTSTYLMHEKIYDYPEYPYNAYEIITNYKNISTPKKTSNANKFWKSINHCYNCRTLFENRNMGKSMLSKIVREKCREVGIERGVKLYPSHTKLMPNLESSKRQEQNVTDNYRGGGYNYYPNLNDQYNRQNIPQNIPQNSSLPLIQNIPQNSSLPLIQNIPQNSSSPLIQNIPQNSSLPLIQNIPQNYPLPVIQNIPSLETQQESVLNYNQGSSALNLHLNPQNRGITMATGKTGPVFNFNGGNVTFTFNFNIVNSNVERKRNFETHNTNFEKKKK